MTGFRSIGFLRADRKYVAFPHRGEEVPGAPWLGDAMTRGVEALPTLEDDEGTGRTTR